MKILALRNLILNDQNINICLFKKLKIRNKNEIVTLRTKFADPTKISGKKVKYNQWNKIIKDKDTIVIDVRNEFEVNIGSFKGAINPKTKSFTDFKSFVQKKLNKSKDKKNCDVLHWRYQV